MIISICIRESRGKKRGYTRKVGKKSDARAWTKYETEGDFRVGQETWVKGWEKK